MLVQMNSRNYRWPDEPITHSSLRSQLLAKSASLFPDADSTTPPLQPAGPPPLPLHPSILPSSNDLEDAAITKPSRDMAGLGRVNKPGPKAVPGRASCAIASDKRTIEDESKTSTCHVKPALFALTASAFLRGPIMTTNGGVVIWTEFRIYHS